MPFSLQVVGGRHAGVHHAVTAGEPLVVGRSINAGFSLPEDMFLSGSHFSIQLTGGGILLRDLQSTSGTFVNGSRIEEKILQIGDLINAGSHEFRLLDVAASEPEDATKPISLPPVLANPLLRHILSLGVPAFFLLDAASNDAIPAWIAGAKERAQCLYDGRSAVELAPWAPYLIELSWSSKLAEDVLHEGWGKGWASFFVSRQSFDDLRHHFRKFLMVKIDDGAEAYFRFYDPRVLREFLFTANSEELVEFFGTVERWLIEGKDPAHFLDIKCSDGRLQIDQKPFSQQA